METRWRLLLLLCSQLVYQERNEEWSNRATAWSHCLQDLKFCIFPQCVVIQYLFLLLAFIELCSQYILWRHKGLRDACQFLQLMNSFTVLCPFIHMNEEIGCIVCMADFGNVGAIRRPIPHGNTGGIDVVESLRRRLWRPEESMLCEVISYDGVEVEDMHESKQLVDGVVYESDDLGAHLNGLWLKLLVPLLFQSRRLCCGDAELIRAMPIIDNVITEYNGI